MNQYLEYVMRGISNIIFNSKHGGASKEEIADSLQRILNEYNETFNKNIK